MKKEFKLKFPISYYLIYLLIPYTLSNLFGLVLEIDLNSKSKFLYTLLIGIGVKVLSLFPSILFIMIVLSGFGLVVLNYYFPNSANAFIAWIWQFLWNIVKHVQGKESVLDSNSIPLWVLLVILICIYTHVFLFKIKRPLFLIPLYYPFFIYYWYIYIDPSYKAMILFTFLLIMLVALKRFQEEKIDLKYKTWLKTAIVYGLISTLLGASLPEAGSKINWPWLENKAYTYFPVIADMRPVDTSGASAQEGQWNIFSLQETGFSPNGSRLGGPVKQSNKEVMKVTAPYPVYLRGRVSETYLNNQWSTGKWNYNRQWVNKNIPTNIPMGARKYDVLEISVTYTNFSSNTVFTPYMPISITDIDGKTIFTDENNQITAPSGVRINEGYKVISLLNHAPEKFSMERNIDREHYLQLPHNLSSKIYDLSKTITNGLDGDYEKALAIEDYLRKNYKYSLEVPYVPEGKEFVEHFLFEEMEGYCTYFATAMTVLLRTQDIPSRYIEGYKMPKDSKNGVYTITQREAHAWVEVYLENEGWITLDPTPSSDTGDISNHSIEDSQQEESGAFSDELDQEDPLHTTNRNSPGLGMVDEIGLEEERNLMKDQGKKISQLLNMSKEYILLITFSSFALWILLRMAISYYSRKKYHRSIQKLSNNDQIVHLYDNILKMLEHIGYSRNLGETPYEFSQRISSRIYDYDINFQYITDIFVKAKYSHGETDHSEIKICEDYLSSLEKKVRVKLGRVKYLYYKYFSNNLYALRKLQKG